MPGFLGKFAAAAIATAGVLQPAEPTGPAAIMEARAPAKAFVPIEGAGHFAVFMKPAAFVEQLVARVLPLATAR